MKMLNKKFVRTLSCAAVAVCAAAMLSVGAFAAEVDSTCVEGYLPPQEQMVQGDIALHSGDVAVGQLRRLRCPGGQSHSGQYHADLRR